MKKLKSTTLGILIGAVTTLSITALADYIVAPNSFPVKVNGQTVQVEGYNINDSTYFKLRDVADAVGGFEVGFKDNTIIVSTLQKPTQTPTPLDEPINGPFAIKSPYGATRVGATTDGLPIYDYYQNLVVLCKDLSEKYPDYEACMYSEPSSDRTDLKLGIKSNKTDSIVVKNLTFNADTGPILSFIYLSEYYSMVLPILQD
ncbi:hypothetical protein FMM68_09695 [Lachnospiraceae bacterium MD329]|nr:hypothetical protein [Lachnospiraceae bacterium MD329]